MLRGGTTFGMAASSSSPSSPSSRISVDLLEVFDVIQNHLGDDPGDYYVWQPGPPGVHDGRIVVRWKSPAVRVVVLDYGVHPTRSELREAARLSHVRLLDGSGSKECASFGCVKVGVPVVVYDSHPHESLDHAILFKTGKCFRCAEKAASSSRRHGIRPSPVRAVPIVQSPPPQSSASPAKRSRGSPPEGSKRKQAKLKASESSKTGSPANSTHSGVEGSARGRKQRAAAQSPPPATTASAGAATAAAAAATTTASTANAKKSRVPAQRRGGRPHRPRPTPRASPSAALLTPTPPSASARRILAKFAQEHPNFQPPVILSNDATTTTTTMTTNGNTTNNNNTAIIQHPQQHNGPQIKFSWAPIRQHLVCGFCHGLFREPYTLTECLHTFCRSCILIAQSHHVHSCPTCGVYLGQDLAKFAHRDRNLHFLIDKIFFPELVVQELQAEAAFYASHGIRRKPRLVQPTTVAEEDATTAVNSNNNDTNSNSNDTTTNRTVRFELVPAPPAGGQPRLPPLACSILETSGTIRIGQLKKYLEQQKQQLQVMTNHNNNDGSNVEEKDNDNGKDDDDDDEQEDAIAAQDLEIVYHDLPLGNELSVTFIMRTVWMEDHNIDDEEGDDLDEEEDDDEEDRKGCLRLGYRLRSGWQQQRKPPATAITTPSAVSS